MRLFLAPMEGVVDFHLRQIYSKIGGIDSCVTEFIRVSETPLPRKVYTKYCPELIHPNKDTLLPIRVQLLGSNPTLLAQSAYKAASLGAIGIDLNFGCPAKTVNRNRGGACLLDETELVHDIVYAVRKAVPADVPVSAKIRLGFENRDSYLENAQAIAAAGANELFVHARSKNDGYKPPAYWDCIGEINDKIKIPVIANGEIWSIEDFIRCRSVTGCEDFMMGRGLLANPDLALKIKSYVDETKYNALSWSEVAELLLQFFEITGSAYPAKYLGNRVKQWLHYLQLHYPEAKQLFENIKRSKDYAFIVDEINSSKQ